MRGVRDLLWRSVWVIALLMWTASCEDLYPVVAVKNGFDEASGVQVANLRWNGCVWPDALPPGKASAFHVCLPGQGRVYFQKLDPAHPELGWQGRRSVTVFDASTLTSLVLTVGPGEDERDTEAVGPYGH